MQRNIQLKKCCRQKNDFGTFSKSIDCLQKTPAKVVVSDVQNKKCWFYKAKHIKNKFVNKKERNCYLFLYNLFKFLRDVLFRQLISQLTIIQTINITINHYSDN